MIPFYPALGNHEALTNTPAYMQETEFQVASSAVGVEKPAENSLGKSRDEQIGEVYEASEDVYGISLLSKSSGSVVASAVNPSGNIRMSHAANRVDLSKPKEQVDLQKLATKLNL